ncbi:MAG: FliH/SctL family protein [Phycisphaerae bacterium]|jgi:flagellar assembly protein FliH
MARIIKTTESGGEGAERSAVLKLTDFAQQARELVLEARTEAGRIVSEARAKADSMVESASQLAYDEGFARGQNDGYADGQRQGLEAARSQQTASIAELELYARRVIDELAAARARILRDAGEESLDLALAIARKVVGVVAVSDVSAAKANLEKVLELACGFSELSVHVNPAQLASLQEHCGRVASALSLPGRIEVVADAEIGPGGVKILSRAGEIDGTIETQLDAIVAALTGASRAGAPVADGTYLSESAAHGRKAIDGRDGESLSAIVTEGQEVAGRCEHT